MRPVRHSRLAWVASSLLAGLPVMAQTTSELTATIAPKPLVEALSEFSALTGLQVFYVSEIATQQVSKGASHGLPVRVALERLLDGTGLRFEFLNERSVRIFVPSAPTPAARPTVAAEGGLPRTRLAGLEEVVVTAQRRSEPLDKVPISAAVWTQEAMEASGVKGIDEIGFLTPGVEFDFQPSLGDFFTNLVIRGVTDMHGTTTGIFLNDTPLPPGRGETFHRLYPVTFDLDRVEVLRGPQGGLLGHDALGGAFRFIVNDPSLTTFSGQVRTEVAATARGDLSYEAGAALGGPMIADVLGCRVSGWYRSDGGYIDRVNPLSGATVDDNANPISTASFRAAVTWQPTDSLQLTPLFTYQSTDIRNPSTFYVHLSDPAAGDLRNGNQTEQPFDDTLYLAALKVMAEHGSAELSTVISYLHRTADAALDLSPIDVIDPLSALATQQQDVFSFEARLASADPDAALTWLAGAWLSSSRVVETSIVGSFDDSYRSTVTDLTDLAGFGQVALRIGQHVTASAGLRVGRSEYDSVTEVPPSTRVADGETSATPRVALSYLADDRNLFYLTVAKGFRSSGIYAPVLGCGYGPLPYASDSLWSYEAGAKTFLLQGRLNLDANIFLIRWDNDQPPPGYDCVPNNYRPISSSVSSGFNLAARVFPSDRVRLGLAVGYLDARYSETIELDGEVIIQKGDALGTPPLVPSPWNITGSVEYDVSAGDDITVTLRAEDVYHSENPGPFHTRHPASAFYAPDSRGNPATNVLNLRATLQHRSFDTAIFVSNALDALPTLLHSPGDHRAATFRPRTVGLSVTWRY
jgi:outer membrane receptor protein involved in Fe transport